MFFAIRKKFYECPYRFFNILLWNENAQIDACLGIAIIFFWRGLKIELWHDFDIPQFNWRLFSLRKHLDL